MVFRTMSGKDANDLKYHAVTNFLYDFFWNSFYLIFLPVILSVITAGIVNLSANLTGLNFPVLFTLIVPIAGFFILPSEKHRKKKIILREYIINKRHYGHYFLISAFSIIYSLILTFSFGDSLYISILHPIFSLISLIFYFKSRNLPDKNWSIKDIRNRKIEQLLIISGISLRSVFVITFSSFKDYFLIPIICTLVLDILGYFTCIFIFNRKIKNEEDLISDHTDEENTSEKLSKRLKSEILGISIPIVQIITLITVGFWFLNFYLVNIIFLIFIPIMGLTFSVKSIHYAINYYLETTSDQNLPEKPSKIAQLSSIFSSIFLLSCTVLFMLEFFQFSDYLYSHLYVVTILVISYLEFKKEMLSKKFLTNFITSSSILLLSMITAVIRIDPNLFVLNILIFSILLYLDIEFLKRLGIQKKKKIDFVLSIISSLIIYEIILSITEIFAGLALSGFDIPFQMEFAFKFESYTLALLIGSIVSGLKSYYTSYEMKTNRIIKKIFLTLHSLLIINIVGLLSFTTLDIVSGLPLPYQFLMSTLIPAIVTLLLSTILFYIYHRIGIYSLPDYVRLILYSFQIQTFLVGTSIISTNFKLSSFLVSSLILTGEIILDQRPYYCK